MGAIEPLRMRVLASFSVRNHSQLQVDAAGQTLAAGAH
jgi:hypothetical protein